MDNENRRGVGRTPEMEADIGARVRMMRTMRGMSQEKLAEQLGVSFQQIQKYEKGTNRIAVSTLVKIGAALCVPWIDLVPKGEEVTEIGMADRPAPHLITKGTNIAIALSKLDRKVASSLEKHIAALAAENGAELSASEA